MGRKEHFSIEDLDLMNLASSNYNRFLLKGDFKNANKSERIIKNLITKKEKLGISDELQKVINFRIEISELKRKLKIAEKVYQDRFYPKKEKSAKST